MTNEDQNMEKKEDSLENENEHIAEDSNREAGEDEPVSPDPQEQIEALERELKQEHERLLRATADLENFRKRTRRDLEDALIRGRTEVLRDVLPVIDSIDLALASADPTSSAEGIIQGMEMVRKQFLTATERFGVKQIESVGKAFDPNFHEAVAQSPSDEYEPGQVIEEMRTGYLLQERLLRAAMVIVAQAKPSADTTQEPPAEASEDAEPQEPSNDG